jgi:predicted MPP superfamily phosphohydrolase
MLSIRSTTPKTERVVFLSDIHVPYHDPVAITLVYKFLSWFKPTGIYVIGDLLDFYSLSRFDKDPTRLLTLQQELDEGVEFLAKLRSICPEAYIYFREGNHEYRLTRYLCAHPELYTLRALQLPAMLKFKDLEIEYCDYNGALDHYGFLVEHGDIVRRHSGYTAKGMLDKRGISGITGHTHRMGSHFQTNTAGTTCWYENGCLCKTDPEYILGQPNWQQGFSVLYSWDNQFAIDQLRISQNRLFYQGRMWEVTE